MRLGGGRRADALTGLRGAHGSWPNSGRSVVSPRGLPRQHLVKSQEHEPYSLAPDLEHRAGHGASFANVEHPARADDRSEELAVTCFGECPADPAGT
jgi:hypothetical protein